MFVLSEFEDIAKIPAKNFGKPILESITFYFNEKFANKVIHEVGLCICLFDVLHIGDSYSFPGDSRHHTKVRFRFVMFRPFINEIIVGKIKSCTPELINISLGFFDDIQIPVSCMTHPTTFDFKEQVWVWEYLNNDKLHYLYLDTGEKIKFRVISEHFKEISPDIGSTVDTKVDLNQKIPYKIIAGINEPGLGILSWWDGI